MVDAAGEPGGQGPWTGAGWSQPADRSLPIRTLRRALPASRAGNRGRTEVDRGPTARSRRGRSEDSPGLGRHLGNLVRVLRGRTARRRLVLRRAFGHEEVGLEG